MNPQAYKIIRSETVLPSLRDISSYPDGKQNPEPLKSVAKNLAVPASILIEKNVARGSNPAELHRHEADLWICLEGSITFELGGKLVDPAIKVSSNGTRNENEIIATKIVGGIEETLHVNDVLYIPEGIPHTHWVNNKPARLWIIKIPAKEIVSLSDIGLE